MNKLNYYIQEYRAHIFVIFVAFAILFEYMAFTISFQFFSIFLLLGILAVIFYLSTKDTMQ